MSKRDLLAMDLSTGINGYRHTALIYAALKLQLPDTLGHRAVHYMRLADEMQCSARHLKRLLNALTVLGLCEELESGTYQLTEAGRALMATTKKPDREMALLAVDQYASAWFNLDYAVRSGKSAFEHLHGTGPFEWRKKNPDANQVFNSWLAKETGRVVASIVEKFDLAGIGKVMDIGGGHGSLLFGLLEKHPALCGILFDQDHVIGEVADSGQESDRVTFVSGDFFRNIPAAEADCLILKSILHDWDDGQVITILENCKVNMKKPSKLVVIERLLPGVSDGAHRAHMEKTIMLDMHMMAVTGGMERTLDEYRELLLESGFELIKVIPTEGGFFLLEALPCE